MSFASLDWQVILTAAATSLFTSGFITAGILYALKKTFDRTVDLKYEKLLQESKLLAEERLRRESSLYDHQVKALQEFIAELRTLRNVGKQLASLSISDENFGTSWNAFREHHEIVQKTVSENRLFLTGDYLRVLHMLDNLVSRIGRDCVKVKMNDSDNEVSGVTLEIQTALRNLNKGYEYLVTQAQANLGVLAERRIYFN